MLCFYREPFRTWCPPCYSDKYLAQETAEYQLVEDGVDYIQNEEEGGLDKDCDDAWLVVGEERSGGCLG